MWLTYGIIKSDLPIIITNALALTFHGMMLNFKIKYKNKDQAAPALAS